MAFEKILNTRIALKIDTLENWLKSTLPLKKGELALATVAASAGTGLTEPVIMIKVGEDGVKTFKDLEWNVYAKSSDVLAACKSEASLKTFINGVIADAGIATNDAMEALAGRVTIVETKSGNNETAIATLNGEGEGSVAKKIADAIAALKLSETYEVKGEAAKVQDELNSYKESNDIALANVKATAEAAYVKPVTGIAKTDLSAEVQTSLGKADTALQSHQDISHLAVKSEVETELGKKVDKTVYEGKVSELETAIGGKVEKVEGKSLVLDTEITKLAGVSEGANKVEGSTVNGKIKIDGVETVVYTHPEKHAISEVTGLQDALDGKQAAGNYSEVGHKHEIGDVNGLQDALDGKQVAGDYATKTEAQGYANAKDEAIAEAKKAGTDAQADVDAIKADYLKGEDKTELEGKITANSNAIERLTNGVSAEEIDGVNDLINYVNTHGPEVKGMKEDIKANSDAIEAINNETTGILAEAKGYADGLAGNYAEAEHTHTKSEITDFAHTHEIGEVNGLQGALDLKANDADLKAVAKSGLIDDLSIGEGTILVFDCGNSVV